MQYNELFDRYTFVIEKATQYGFEGKDGSYYYRRPLRESGFYVQFCMSQKLFQADVYEEPNHEEYLPFNVIDAASGFVVSIRENVNEIIKDILENCFEDSDCRAIIFDYVKCKYGTKPETPWKKYKEYYTLKTEKKQKWYGVLMLIPYKYLGLEKEGQINVLNVKVKPEKIPELIDHIHYFPAYHMNKKYWLSILLDKSVDLMQVKQLIDESYESVEGKNRS